MKINKKALFSMLIGCLTIITLTSCSNINNTQSNSQNNKEQSNNYFKEIKSYNDVDIVEDANTGCLYIKALVYDYSTDGYIYILLVDKNGKPVTIDKYKIH